MRRPTIPVKRHKSLKRSLQSASSLASFSSPSSPAQRSEAERSNDFSIFMCAEITDHIISSKTASPTSSSPLRAGDKVPATPAQSLFNDYNSAVWVPVLSSLHRRGMLTPADYTSATRYLAPMTYQTLLPWIWERNVMPEKVVSRGGVEASSAPALPADMGNNASIDESALHENISQSLSEVASEAVQARHTPRVMEDLRTAAPRQWPVIVDHLLQQEKEKASANPLSCLPLWHSIFFVLCANPALRTSRTLLQEAHPFLSRVVSSYYDDVVEAQNHASPPVPKEEGAVHVVTRLPPIIMRRWRKLYRAQGALQLYAELFLLCVAGEEQVLSALYDTWQLQQSGQLDAAQPKVLYTTAALQDTELWQFFLTIPGRRDSGLEWGRQWALTKDFARISFSYLLTSLLHAGRTVQRDARGDAYLASFSTDDLAVLEKATALCMNVCMWVRNDNDEGGRFASCVATIMSAYADTCDRLRIRATDKATWALLKMVRQAGLTAMWEKTEKLRYGPSSGYLGVCTVSAALDSQRPFKGETADRMSAARLALLLHHDKKSALDVWTSLETDPAGARQAALYALFTVGTDVAAKIATLAETNPSACGSARRMQAELRQWAHRMGRPLRLQEEEVELLWMARLQQRGGSLALRWRLLSEDAPSEASADTWQCGCSYAKNTKSSAACIACVSSRAVPFAWECPSCHAQAGQVPMENCCLACGAAHPLLDSGHTAAGATTPTALNSRAITAPDADACCEHPVCVPFTSTCSHTSKRAPLYGCADCGKLLTTPSSRAHKKKKQKQAAMTTSTTPLCYHCTCCDSYTLLSDPTRKPHCDTCGADEGGYVRSYFTWRCGCGAENSPLHTHCWRCSLHKKAPALHCTLCTQPMAHDAVSCSFCARPHPRQASATETHRMMACASCHTLMPVDARTCAACAHATAGLTRPCSETYADTPWRCHACGHGNALRDAYGTLAASHPSALHACEACHTARPPTTTWELGHQWTCAGCGAVDNYGFACAHCLRTPLPGVTVWQCGRCQTCNESWRAVCAHAGCGARQADQEAGHVCHIPYAPWECTTCGEVLLHTHCDSCTACGAPVPADVVAAAQQEERRQEEALGVVEPPPPPPPLALSPDSFAADASRLDAIEASLLKASPWKLHEGKLVVQESTMGSSLSPPQRLEEEGLLEDAFRSMGLVLSSAPKGSEK